MKERIRNTSKHRNLINVIESPRSLSLKTGPEVGYQNLGSFQEMHFSSFDPFVLILILMLNLLILIGLIPV